MTRIMRVDYRRKDGRRYTGFWYFMNEWKFFPTVILPDSIVEFINGF